MVPQHQVVVSAFLLPRFPSAEICIFSLAVPVAHTHTEDRVTLTNWGACLGSYLRGCCCWGWWLRGPNRSSLVVATRRQEPVVLRGLDWTLLQSLVWPVREGNQGGHAAAWDCVRLCACCPTSLCRRRCWNSLRLLLGLGKLLECQLEK